YLSGYGSNAVGDAALACTKGVANPAGIPTSTCDPNKLTAIEYVGPGTPNPDKVVIPSPKSNFGPAIGFAWQVPWFGEGKTAMRGGYQRTYGNAGRNGIDTDTLLGSAPGNTISGTANLSDATLANILATRSLNLTDLPLLVPYRPLRAPGQTVPIYGHSI